MFKKLIIFIFLFSINSYSADANRSILPESFERLANNETLKHEDRPTTIVIPESIAILPEIIKALPEESKLATLEVIKSTSKVISGLMKSSRQICDEDSKKLLDRVEHTTENISKIVSQETQTLINNSINIIALKGLFGLAIYQGYFYWQKGNTSAIFYILFGLVGFLYVQNLLNIFEKFSDLTMKYVQTNLNQKKIDSLITKALRIYKKSEEKINWQKFKELQNTSIAYVCDKSAIRSSCLILKNVQEDLIQEEKYDQLSLQQNSKVNIDQILDHALDEYDANSAQ